MKVTTIQGSIETLGEWSKVSGERKMYDYISFRTTTGEEVLAQKVRVPDDVARILALGATGTSVISNVLFHKEIHAAKVGDREAMVEWLQGGMWNLCPYCIFLLLLGLLLYFVLIEIPLVVPVVLVMISFPFWRANMLESAPVSGSRYTVGLIDPNSVERVI